MNAAMRNALLPLLRLAALLSLAAALICLLLAIAFPSDGRLWVHVIVGVTALAMNGMVYARRRQLLERQWRSGWPALALGAFGGALVLLDGGHHTPYLTALYTGLALALAAGQAGHALLAAVAVTGSYLAGLAIRHHALLDSAVIVNVLTPFAVVAVAYPVQHWFALFVARGNGDVAFIDDMPRLRHPHAEHFAADAELVPAGVGNHPSVVRSSFPSKSRASTTLSFAERIALLDDEQLRIVDLAARGYRRRNIAQAMALSEPAIRVRRARAQQLTGTRSFEQLIGMYRHVQNRAAGQQHNA